MSALRVHEDQCRKILGEPFTEVHQFLDQYNDPVAHPFTAHLHRRRLHHLTGLQLVAQRFGGLAFLAACLHILEDCLGYLPQESDYDTGVVDEYGRPKDPRLIDTHWFKKLTIRHRTS